MKKVRLKTPISYYGGKQMMLRHILPNIPDHDVYTESFFGGGAVFWAKERAKVEVINDVNREVINFYQVLQAEYYKLNALIQTTMHSRAQYEDALVVYNHPHLFDNIRRAWAFWVLCNQGFACKIGNWGYDKSSGSVEKKIDNAKQRFGADLKEWLERVQIESNCATKVIKSRDKPTTFHYCDPPYFNSDCGHYDGYGPQDYTGLLNTLSDVKGKFLLSSYRSDILDDYTNQNGWHQLEFEKTLAVSQRAKSKKKVEVLTANYPLQMN